MLGETPYSNPVAPQWAYPDWGVTPHCESDFTYTFPITVPTAGVSNRALQFGFDSSFHITDTYVRGLNQDAVNSFEVRLVDDTKKRRVNNFVQVNHYNGFVPKSWVVAPGGVQRIDIRNLSGISHDVWVIFRGRKRFQNIGCVNPPAGYAPVEYTPLWARYSVAPFGFEDEPFVYSFDVWDVTAPIDRLVEGVPLALDTDAGFLARSVTMNVTSSDANTLWAARLVDPSGRRLALQINQGSTTLPYPITTNFGGPNSVATTGRNIYPELSAPAGSVLGLDVRLVLTAGTSVGVVRIQGVKRHKK